MLLPAAGAVLIDVAAAVGITIVGGTVRAPAGGLASVGIGVGATARVGNTLRACARCTGPVVRAAVGRRTGDSVGRRSLTGVGVVVGSAGDIACAAGRRIQCPVVSSRRVARPRVVLSPGIDGA